MMDTYFRLKGSQYDYKVPYDGINGLFLLPRTNGNNYAFVISLDKPIRQGQQKYQHLVWETHKLDGSIELNITPEEAKDKYDSQLEPEMSGPMSNLIAKVFKVLSQSPVFIPKQYVSDRENSCVKCNLKTNEGHLYPLGKCFIFINKPALVVKYEDLELVEFKISAQNTVRLFEMVFVIKVNAKSIVDGKELAFSGIDKSEFNNLHSFLESKKIKIKKTDTGGNIYERQPQQKAEIDFNEMGIDEDEDSEDDEDYQGEDSASDDDSDDPNPAPNGKFSEYISISSIVFESMNISKTPDSKFALR